MSAIFALAACGGAGSTPASGPVGLVPQAVRPHASQTCSVSNASNFNGTSVAAGDAIWFSSVMKVSGQGQQPVTVEMSNASVSVGSGASAQTIPMPNASVTIDPSVSSPSLSYDVNSNTWFETVPAGTSGNVYLDGGAWLLAQQLAGGANPVTWSANFASSVPVSINWQWAAAAYSQLGTQQVGGKAVHRLNTGADGGLDLNTLSVKPLDDNHYAPTNSDHAGTPEADKSYLLAGARGGGVSNYTGGYSGTVSVTPCAAGGK